MEVRNRLRVLRAPTPEEEVRGAIHDFLRRAEARGLSPRTLDFYRYRLQALAAWLDRQGFAGGPENLTPARLRDFLAQKRARASAAHPNSRGQAALVRARRGLRGEAEGELVPSCLRG